MCVLWCFNWSQCFWCVITFVCFRACDILVLGCRGGDLGQAGCRRGAGGTRKGIRKALCRPTGTAPAACENLPPPYTASISALDAAKTVMSIQDSGIRDYDPFEPELIIHYAAMILSRV